MKKVIGISIIILVVIVVLLVLFNRRDVSNNENLAVLAPTKYQVKPNQAISPTIGAVKNLAEILSNLTAEEAQQLLIIKDKIPLLADDFLIDYSASLQRYVVTVKNNQGKTKFYAWLNENSLSTSLVEKGLFIITNKTPEELLSLTPTLSPNDHTAAGADSLIAFFNFLFTPPDLSKMHITISGIPVSVNPFPSPTIISSSYPQATNALVYYSQCGGKYDSYALPGGCNICTSGCGPTTTAMILSSYISSSYNPASVVDLYKQTNRSLGCGGSKIQDAKSLLDSKGVLTSDLISYGNQPADKVAADLKKYINAGWTIFALGHYCDKGCAHFFWIVDIDEANNIWAYDPYYGKGQSPPINENSRYPFPKYRLAFAIKKHE